jgi:deoxyinosine 3'endonuclease (endonuclease V)
VDVPPAWPAEQKRLAALRVDHDELDWSLTEDGEFCGLRLIAGLDLSRFPDDSYAVATVVILSFPQLDVVYERSVIVWSTVPYVRGFLAFREVPSLAALLKEVPAQMTPQIVYVDGNGAFHPRQCGAATHLGVATGFPTIGVAKKVMAVGEVNTTVARKVSRELQRGGTWAPLVASDSTSEAVAALLRPTDGRAPPLVVSTGHRISLKTAATLTAAVCLHRVAEPIRQADLRSRQAVRSWLAGAELPTVYLREPGTKRKSGQASLLPVVNRMLKQGRQARCDLDEPLRMKGIEQSSECEHESVGWGYAYPFLSWLLRQGKEALTCCIGRHVAEDSAASYIVDGVAVERAPEIEDKAEKAPGYVVNDAVSLNSTEVRSTKAPASMERPVCGATTAQSRTKSRVQLKWCPKLP